MNSPFPDDLINAANEDVAAAIPSLIDAAVASFDADRDTSRHYLLRASALLRVKRRATHRGCMHDDEDNAGAALPGCGRVRTVRPGASLQSVSPHDRHEPIGLASRDTRRWYLPIVSERRMSDRHEEPSRT
jgi:hypothetical protein